MKSLFLSIALAAAALAAAPPAASAQSFAWWKSEPFKKEVGLTADQCSRIDTVFQSSLPKLRQAKNQLDKEEAELSRLIEADADDADVIRQVDQVEATRAVLNKARTLMLVHMRQVLTPDQRVKFKAAHDRWERDRRRASRDAGGHGADRHPLD